MNRKKLVASIFLKEGKAVNGLHNGLIFGDGDAVALACQYEYNGADGLLVFDLSTSLKEHHKHVELIRQMSNTVDLGISAGGHLDRIEDIENLLNAGCERVFLNMSKTTNVDMLKTAAERFGKERIAISLNEFAVISGISEHLINYTSVAILFGDSHHLYDAVRQLPIRCIPFVSETNFAHTIALLQHENVDGIAGGVISNLQSDLLRFRQEAAKRGISLQKCETSLEWQDFKLNSDQMIPVIVQDYKTNEVLMMAYMNEEAFHQTLLTGRMTYYSRSRQKLWLKGETSGHYQYVRQIMIDCDNDTLLAKVHQVGAACHTGNYSCFYRELVPVQFKGAIDAVADKKIQEDAVQLLQILRNMMKKLGISWEDVLGGKGNI